MTRISSQIGTVLSALFVAVLFGLCVVFVALRVLGLSPFVVTGASMEPNIHRGSLIFVEPLLPSEVRLGDVITFSQYDQLTTHRVIAIDPTPAGLVFTTRGDANAVADPEQKSFPGYAGVVRGSVPAAGFVVAYIQYYWRLALTLIAAVVFFSCAAMVIFRRDAPRRSRRTPRRRTAMRSAELDEVWNAHLQWVRQATAQRITA